MEGRALALFSIGNCILSDDRGLRERQWQHHPQLQIFLLPPLPLGSAASGVGAPQGTLHKGNVLASTPLTGTQIR